LEKIKYPTSFTEFAIFHLLKGDC